MTTRANVCVLLLILTISAGCASIGPSNQERKCERVETAWDEQTQTTKIVEYDCVVIDPVKDRDTWMIVFQVFGAVIGIVSLLL